MADESKVPEGEAVAAPENVVDLELLRDERVIPVARGALADMVNEMVSVNMNANSDFTALLMKILQRSLDADLNLATENPFIFTFILDQFSAFSSIIQSCAITPTPDERYSKIGSELLQVLVEANLPMGKAVTPEDQKKALEPFKEKFEAIFARESLTWLEVKYILEGLFNGFKMTQSLFTNNMQRSVDRMEARILGVETIGDITMSKLNWALVSPFEEIRKANDTEEAEG